MFGYLIFVSIFAIVHGKYDVFQNQSIELKLNQLAFFETPNYPQLQNASIFPLFNTTFYTTEISENGTKAIFVLQGLSWNPFPFKNTADVYIFNIDSFYLETFRYFYTNYDAFSGYIYFTNADDQCPFESLAGEMPYNFTDENEILFLQSAYKNHTSFGDVSITSDRISSCNWKFIVPSGYGIKIVIQNLTISSETKFKIQNTTDILANERDAKIMSGYYNSDNIIEIYLSKDDAFISKDLEFSAYISIVKTNVKKQDGGCVINKEINSITWSSSNNISLGYDNNVKCTFNITVNSTTTFLATVNQLSLEKNIDYVTFTDGEYSYELKYMDQFLLQPKRDGSDKTYAFEFVTDGSFVASGFSITFLENVCKCSNPSILCNSTPHNVMNKTSYDCSGLTCSFLVEPCESEYTLLLINAANYGDLDYIKVYTNSILVFNSQSNQYNFLQINYDTCLRFRLESKGEIYLKSTKKNIIEVSSISKILKTASFTTAPFNLPLAETAVSVILTTSNPNYVIDESVTSFKSHNYSIIVSGSNLKGCNKVFFNDAELTKQIVFEKCKLSNPYSCMSQTNKIVMYTNPTIHHTALIAGCYTVFTLNSHAKHCVFSKSIYYIEGPLSRISAMAAEDGECVLTLLKESENFYVLSNIFTNNNNNENVVIYSGTKKDAALLEFTSKTLSTFINVKIVSDVYTVIVPKNSSLMLTFTLINLPFVEQITNMPYTSVLSTVNYGRKQCSPYTPPFMVYTVGEVAIQFTVLQFQVHSVVYFGTADRNYSVHHIGEIFVFKNTKVSVYQAISRQDYCGCLFYVETVNNLPMH